MRTNDGSSALMLSSVAPSLEKFTVSPTSPIASKRKLDVGGAWKV